jgi:hypothetical protein
MPKLLLIGLAVGLAATPALAQQSSPPANKPVTAKPAAAKPTAPNPAVAKRPVQRAAVREPIDPARGLGRVPLENSPGSFGVGTLSDGRRPPGQEVYDQRSSSYVGLSLSVPTNSKSFIVPVPLIGRPE